MNKRSLGTEMEEKSCAYLTSQGMVILERNFRCRTGEIDVIADDAGTVVFVEVKYRKDRSAGHPEEAVGKRKQETIRRVALFYQTRKNLPLKTPMRFDVIAIEGEELRHYRNAF